MLVVGLFAGYFTRPLINRPVPSPTTIVKATLAPQNTQEASQAGLKEVVVAQTRHFLGDANAPVTIIEFSDFQ